MKRDKVNTQSGFTIIEILVTLALIMLMVPALTLGLSTLTQLNNRARDLTLISIISENKIESLRSIGFNSIDVGTVDFSDELPSEIASPKSASYTVTENNGIKTVDITVQYSDYRHNRTINYKSVISETGVGQ
ncbi:prepilin-type N-terminal cleavage/methylation domain-containing protein [Candidatus Saccharibacteria bacterium]|nr:prepilin-type N-terminal cleavage/methylation domain-containing protein [Candidatus Saccharibacteria bacterium]